MLSKSAVERQLAHFKSGECGHHTSEENRHWIAALEWVLGNEEHQRSYAAFLKNVEILSGPEASKADLRKVLEAALMLLR